MTLPAHNLGSHISRGPAGLFGVLGVPYPGDAEIGHSQIALVVKDQVFGFDVPVYDALAVDIFQGHCNACHKKPGLVLCELSVFRNVIAEVAPGSEVHHQIEVISVLKCELHIHNETV